MSDDELVYLSKLTDSCRGLVQRFPRHLRQECVNELNSLVYLAYIDAKSKGFENKESSIRVTVLHRLKDFVCTHNGPTGRKHPPIKRQPLVDCVSPDTECRELLELIHTSCVDQFMRSVVSLRIQGYTQSDIASKLKVSQRWISMCLQKFQDNFRREHGETLHRVL